MSNQNFCPRCGESASLCACNKKSNPAAARPQPNRYCSVKANGRPCKNFRDMSPTYDKDSIWYCIDHWDTIGDSISAEAIINKQYEK